MCRAWLAVCVLQCIACGATGGAAAPAQTQLEKQRQAAKERRAGELLLALGDDAFAVREAAHKELIEIGEPSRALLRNAAKASGDLEVRRRAQDILRHLDRQAAQRARDALRATRKAARPPSFDAAHVRPLVDKRGVIAADETWPANRSYRVSGPLRVATGATLTIEPGTVVLVAGKFDIEVERGAALVARSDDARRPIVLTALAEKDGRQGHWGRLVNLGRLDLKHVQVRRSSGVVAGRDSKPSFDDLGVYYTAGNAVTFDQCYGEQGRVVVRHATGVGVAFPRNPTFPHFQELVVSHCDVGMSWAVQARLVALEATVHDCRAGLHVTGQSYPFFLRLTVADCAAHGMLIEGGSYPRIKVVVLEDIPGVGIALKGGSYPTFGAVDAATRVKTGQQVEAGSRVRPWDGEAVSRETGLWLQQQRARKGGLGLPGD
jgi:hypothetical protein